jgi:hypothetical protein
MEKFSAGHVKKRKAGPELLPPPLEEVKKMKKEKEEEEKEQEGEEEQETKKEEEEEEKEKELRCEECGILFSQRGTYAAHRQYYCQKRRRGDETE